MVDYIDELINVFWIMRILGLTRFTCSKEADVPVVKSSRFQLCYGTLIFIGLLVIQILILYDDFTIILIQNYFTKIVMIFQNVMNIISILIFYLSLIENKDFPKILKNISKFDNSIKGMRFKTRKLIKVNILSSFYWIISILIFYFLGIRIKEFTVHNFLVKFIKIICILITYYPLIFMSDILLMVGRRFKTINSQLASRSHGTVILDLGIYTIRISKNARMGKKNVSVDKYLMNLHNSLCETAEFANSFFKLRALLSITCCLLSVVCYCHFCFDHLFIAGHKLGIYSLADRFNFDICARLFPFIKMLSSCTVVANRTAVLVHKLLNVVKDPEIREELQLFSLQLLHRKVQFTACGFFPLDFTLLYSIIGAVTTYLVILIQFQLTLSDQLPNITTAMPNITDTSLNVEAE
ncbi:hypothetical protein L9F63_010317 [Diploptera punctata]|uniref:Gustatory receptor n=1 Tax=Diploptera punctata TaxID=6984 RepID=A0AAD8EQS0_DIPPU|nr:hypothetical protein L9F63_010317 [Diploptera punctata]